MKMPKSKSYEECLISDLECPSEAAAYLDAALEDEDPRVFLVALRDVAEAQGGMKKLSDATHLNRENLYKMLSQKGNPRLLNLESLLHTMGLRLAIEVRKAL